MSNPKRIIAMGDIHGDLDLMITCFLIPNLIIEKQSERAIELNGKYYDWIGGKTIVVQVGDQIDRCRPNGNICINPATTFEDEASDIKILYFFTNLDKLAKVDGGAVHSLLGNHEIMNVRGDPTDYNYVSYKGIQQFIPEELLGKINIKDQYDWRRQFFKRGGKMAKYLSKNRKLLIIVDGYLFAHAGVIGTLTSYYKNNNGKEILENINNDVSSWLKKGSFYNDNINFIINNLDSPIWVRKLGTLETGLSIDDAKCNDTKLILKKFNINGMIVGHTPQISGINSTCDGKLHRIDVGSSRAFNTIMDYKREPQVLEILIKPFQDHIFNILK